MAQFIKLTGAKYHDRYINLDRIVTVVYYAASKDSTWEKVEVMLMGEDEPLTLYGERASQLVSVVDGLVVSRRAEVG